MVKRKFEIELNVPDDFDATYSPPYQFGSRCVIREGMLGQSRNGGRRLQAMRASKRGFAMMAA